jgi:hypothetical protein
LQAVLNGQATFQLKQPRTGSRTACKLLPSRNSLIFLVVPLLASPKKTNHFTGRTACKQC